MTGPARGPHAWVPEFVQLGAIRGSSFLFMPGLTVTFVIPGFAVRYGVLFLGETLTPWMLLCAGVIVCGTALSTALPGAPQPSRARRA